MKSWTVPPLWALYDGSPMEIKILASKAYRLWMSNPSAKGLNFKRVSESEAIYSVRIGRTYRALGLLEGDAIYWYFIGNHDAYERELKKV
ncbi:MAG: hypothetical protein WAX48_10590 [Desulfosalsimonadaceae bacterium]